MSETAKEVGQLFTIGFHGTEVTPALREVLTMVRPGGLILFKRNVESPAQIARLCAEAQEIILDGGSPPFSLPSIRKGA